MVRVPSQQTQALHNPVGQEDVQIERRVQRLHHCQGLRWKMHIEWGRILHGSSILGHVVGQPALCDSLEGLAFDLFTELVQGQ